MFDALDKLLNDNALRTQLAENGQAIRARDGLRAGADIIESVALGLAGPSA